MARSLCQVLASIANLILMHHHGYALRDLSVLVDPDFIHLNINHYENSITIFTPPRSFSVIIILL